VFHPPNCLLAAKHNQIQCCLYVLLTCATCTPAYLPVSACIRPSVCLLACTEHPVAQWAYPLPSQEAHIWCQMWFIQQPIMAGKSSQLTHMPAADMPAFGCACSNRGMLHNKEFTWLLG
jgi:hypothetical protein